MILSAIKPLNVPYSTSRSKLHNGFVVIDKPCSKFSRRINQKMTTNKKYAYKSENNEHKNTSNKGGINVSSSSESDTRLALLLVFLSCFSKYLCDLNFFHRA